MTKGKTEKALALRYACNVRTIRRWRKVNAPVTDPARMRAWLAGQRNIPPGTALLLAQTRIVSNAKADSLPQTLTVGVAAALKRLEEMEARSFTELRRAQTKGDPIETKQAHQIWLKNGEALRKHELAIEQSRRDAGELIPRATLEYLAHELQQALYYAMYALEDIIPSVTGLSDPHEVWAIMERMSKIVYASVISYLQRPRNPKCPVPNWLVKAATLGDFPLNAEKDCEQYAAFWAVLSKEMQAEAATARAELDARIAKDKKS